MSNYIKSNNVPKAKYHPEIDENEGGYQLPGDFDDLKSIDLDEYINETANQSPTK